MLQVQTAINNDDSGSTHLRPEEGGRGGCPDIDDRGLRRRVGGYGMREGVDQPSNTGGNTPSKGCVLRDQGDGGHVTAGQGNGNPNRRGCLGGFVGYRDLLTI
eukprot:747177-Hanusia_phi.AAC.1